MGYKEILIFQKDLIDYSRFERYALHHKDVLINRLHKEFWYKYTYTSIERSVIECIDKGILINTNSKQKHAWTNIYFIRDAKSGAIKIGRTYNIIKRMKEIGRYNKIELLAVIKGTELTEKDLHERFAKYNIRVSLKIWNHYLGKGVDGIEWFVPNAELLKFIDEINDNQIYVLNPEYWYKE